MEEELSVAGHRTAVTAREAGPDRIRLDVEGTALDARVVASSEGGHVVELDGRVETLFTARSGATTWVWHRGRARIVERAPPRGAPGTPPPRGSDGTSAGLAAAARPGGPGSVTPPMPSVVVAVLVEAGRRVARGEPLVVVTAMKTETQLVSPVAGRVKAVNVRVGAKVRPGEILVEIEPEGGRDAG
ncbi:MAG TPA: biotin/lipoyl-containing protein [Anaeromyxobacter sp.]